MPLYEYKCKKCGQLFERIQKFSDKPVKKCPKCGGAVEQTISAPAVQFKGTGWYVTDYAKKSGAPASGSESGSKSERKSESETKSENERKKDEKSKADSSKKTEKK